MNREEPLFFEYAGERMLGILHRAQGRVQDVGVLLVVGGPQYRVGSHRQFVLLARELARSGIPVFRFDYRGMGDSLGEPRDFESISDDIRVALDVFIDNDPGIAGVVLWGLCDAATANAFYALSDERVVGQIALNPWVRTSEGEAEAYIRHYYLKRFISREFWRKVLSLKFDVSESLKDLLHKFKQSKGGGSGAAKDSDRRPLPLRLRDAQIGFVGPTLLIISGQDLTAREYENRVAESPEWKAWMGSAEVTLRRLEEADHTFSRARWRDQVAAWSRDWIHRLAD
jgi:exosortase A-associated hydrolase 1